MLFLQVFHLIIQVIPSSSFEHIISVKKTFQDGLDINCRHLDPQTAPPWPQRRLLAYFCRNPFRGVGCSELQEPKKVLKTSHPLEAGARQNHVFGEQKP